MLSAEGQGFAFALPALAAAGKEAGTCEEEGGAAGRGVDGDFGCGGEGVELIADGGLGWGLNVKEKKTLGGVAAVLGLRAVSR